MPQRYNTDDDDDVAALMRLKHDPGMMEYRPRVHEYGSAEAVAAGLEPLEDSPDVLLQPDQYRDALAQAHEMRTLPLYHMYESWRPKGTRYNQNGLGYCWTWSGTGCLMTTRAAEGQPTVLLGPVSMGYLVNWRNEGNYLESFINGARNEGICPAPDGNFNSLERSASYWNNVGQREKYRLDRVWDCRANAMTQHCVSGLCYGRSIYIAYNWWGHALELVGISADTTEWIISNSHNEDDVIILTGSRAIPSEAYIFVSSRFYGE